MHVCMIEKHGGLRFTIAEPRVDTVSGETRALIVVTMVLIRFPNCNLSYVYHGSTSRHPFHDYSQERSSLSVVSRDD